MNDKDKKQPHKNEEDLQKNLDKDLVVKNMPSLSRLSSANYEDRRDQKSKGMSFKGITSVSDDSKQASYRKTGLIIVGAGLVIIVALFYLAYRFLIAPSLQNETVAPVNTTPIIPTDIIIEPETENNIEIINNVVQPVQVIEEEIIPISINNENNRLELPSVLDSDGDGLSDAAEAFLGTDPNNPDTDGDGYSDKEEILNGYNPLGPGLLTDNSNIALFVDPAKQYAVVYPKVWEVNLIDNSVLFAAPDQDFIQISYEDGNRVYANIIDWYEEQFSEVDVLTVDRFVRSSFGPGIISTDGQFVYFLDSNGSRIFVLSYIPADAALPYLEIFQMMVATFMRV